MAHHLGFISLALSGDQFDELLPCKARLLYNREQRPDFDWILPRYSDLVLSVVVAQIDVATSLMYDGESLFV